MQTLSKEVLQSQLEIREQAFSYFASEVHDNIGQSLSAVGLNIYQMESYCTEPNAQRLIRQSTELVSKAINDLRGTIHMLQPEHPANKSLHQAIAQEVSLFNKLTPVKCSLSAYGEPRDLNPEHHILLFRTIQQALSIPVIFLKAAAVDASLHYEPRGIRVCIVHDGVDLSRHPIKGQACVAQMDTRCRLLGGMLDIKDRHPQGNVISITIPRTT